MSTRRDRAARAVAAGIWPAIELDDAERVEAYRIADMVLAEIDRVPDISELIEASSLGTPGAKALRDSVSDEQVQRVLDVANRIRSESKTDDGAGPPPAPQQASANASLAPSSPANSFEVLLAAPYEQFDKRSELLASIEAYAKAVPATAGFTQTDDGVVEPPATPGAVPHPAAQAGEAGWRPAPSSPPVRQPRVFELYRHHDVTGKSGTGTVAWGALWPDGTVSLRWATEHPSTVHWDGISPLLAVHGHGGATEIRWLDRGE